MTVLGYDEWLESAREEAFAQSVLGDEDRDREPDDDATAVIDRTILDQWTDNAKKGAR
jgi:hypothetical protein